MTRTLRVTEDAVEVYEGDDLETSYVVDLSDAPDFGKTVLTALADEDGPIYVEAEDDDEAGEILDTVSADVVDYVESVLMRIANETGSITIEDAREFSRLCDEGQYDEALAFADRLVMDLLGEDEPEDGSALAEYRSMFITERARGRRMLAGQRIAMLRTRKKPQTGDRRMRNKKRRLKRRHDVAGRRKEQRYRQRFSTQLKRHSKANESEEGGGVESPAPFRPRSGPDEVTTSASVGGFRQGAFLTVKAKHTLKLGLLGEVELSEGDVVELVMVDEDNGICDVRLDGDSAFPMRLDTLADIVEMDEPSYDMPPGYVEDATRNYSQCQKCDHFEGGTCTKFSVPVSPEGTCDYFELEESIVAEGSTDEAKSAASLTGKDVINVLRTGRRKYDWDANKSLLEIAQIVSGKKVPSPEYKRKILTLMRELENTGLVKVVEHDRVWRIEESDAPDRAGEGELRRELLGREVTIGEVTDVVEMTADGSMAVFDGAEMSWEDVAEQSGLLGEGYEAHVMDVLEQAGMSVNGIYWSKGKLHAPREEVQQIKQVLRADPGINRVPTIVGEDVADESLGKQVTLTHQHQGQKQLAGIILAYLLKSGKTTTPDEIKSKFGVTKSSSWALYGLVQDGQVNAGKIKAILKLNEADETDEDTKLVGAKKTKLSSPENKGATGSIPDAHAPQKDDRDKLESVQVALDAPALHVWLKRNPDRIPSDAPVEVDGDTYTLTVAEDVAQILVNDIESARIIEPAAV